MKKAIYLTLPLSFLYAYFAPNVWYASVLYLLIPGLVAALLMKVEKISFPILPSGVMKTIKSLLIASLIPVGITACVLLINLLFSNFVIDPQLLKTVEVNGKISIEKLFLVLGIFTLLLTGVVFTFNALLAFGEELMWRGYMLKKLENFPLWKQSVAIGGIWGVWQAPMILFFQHNYPHAPIPGVFLMIAICILLSPIMIQMTKRHRSLAQTTIFSSSLSTISGISLILFPNSNLLYTGVTGISGLIVLVGLNLILYFRQEKVLA